jgi:hypothetical protein
MFRRSRGRRRAVLSAALAVALLPTASGFATAAEGFRAVPTVPMCAVAGAMGRGFNGLADVLGADRASLLAPDIGGTALTSRLTLVDLAGLGEPRLADLWGAGSMAGIRDYVFDEVKPTFIRAHGHWAATPGLTTDPRLTADYHALTPGPVAQEWVRKDAVPDAARLAALRDYLRADRARAESVWAAAPRRACGPTLRPGQVSE